jgi:branched-chain amino acid transport system ATP-binding protein
MLTVENLRVAHGESEAVHDVSLRVDTGEAVAIIGSNGAGKTTLLRALCGLHPPRAGEVVYDGRNLAGMRAYRVARLGISYVPAERDLFPDMTVEENLALGAYFKRAGKEQFAFVFQLFPTLADRRRQRAGTMSGGEQQMLAIGRSLMSQPVLLMLDEPTTGLAPILAEEVYEGLRELHDRGGLTLLVAEQQVPLALYLADRLYVLEDGRIQLHGTADELADNPEVQRAYLGVA